MSLDQEESSPGFFRRVVKALGLAGIGQPEQPVLVPEERRAERIQVQVQVQLKLPSEERVLASTQNLSSTGMSVRTLVPLRPGDEVVVAFRLVNADVPLLHVTTRVVWAVKGDDAALGLQIDEPKNPPGVLERYHAMLARVREGGAPRASLQVRVEGTEQEGSTPKVAPAAPAGRRLGAPAARLPDRPKPASRKQGGPAAAAQEKAPAVDLQVEEGQPEEGPPVQVAPPPHVIHQLGGRMGSVQSLLAYQLRQRRR
jgi:hypothetical protein